MSTTISSPYVIDSIWEKSKSSTYVQVGALTLLTIISAQVVIPLPFTPVPMTLQTFAILFGAAAIGPYKSTLAQFIYLLIAAIGFPVLASDKGGVEALFGATAGYLFAFLVSSYVVGLVAKQLSTRKFINVFVGFFLGTFLIYFFGATWLAFYTGNDLAYGISKGVLPFILGDIVKALLAASLLPVTWKLIKK
ncbi:MAG: biotin transporter BioY [Actinomycetes bacterium]